MKLVQKQFVFIEEQVHLEGVGEVQGYFLKNDPHEKIVLQCSKNNDWDFFTLTKINYDRRNKRWIFKLIASPISKEELHFPVDRTSKQN